MAWQNSTKYVVKRPFPSESDLGPERPNMAPEDEAAGPGEIALRVPEANEQYPGTGMVAANESEVYDLNNLTDAMGYNSPHGPTRSGQRGGAD